MSLHSTRQLMLTLKAPSREPAVCCCVVVAAAYTNRGGRPGLPNCGFKVLNFYKFTQKWNERISDSYCTLNPLWSSMGEVVPARTSLTLHPPSPPTVL